MKKAGGHRNFGYGKQMEWAGKQALRDRYGNGHYGTVTGSITVRYNIWSILTTYGN